MNSIMALGAQLNRLIGEGINVMFFYPLLFLATHPTGFIHFFVSYSFIEPIVFKGYELIE